MSHLPGNQIGRDQHESMLVDALVELSKTSNPLFEYPTEVRSVRNYHFHFLRELIPTSEKRKFRKDRQTTVGRIAVTFLFKDDGVFTVYQPRWLAPLQEELAAISPLLPSQPRIETNYVFAQYAYDAHVTTGALVPEAQIDLAEARQQYWTAKVAEIAGSETTKELPKAD